jgi:hypothetical protein
VDEAVPAPAPEHYLDLVVFDPSPLPDEGDQGAAGCFTFPVLARLAAGAHRTFVVDGAHPGKRAWEKIEAAITALGCVLQKRSDARYRLHDPQTGAARPAVFAALAVPPTVAVTTVHTTLLAHTSRLSRPLTWAACARAAGDEITAAAHRETLARWEAGPTTHTPERGSEA